MYIGIELCRSTREMPGMGDGVSCLVPHSACRSSGVAGPALPLGMLRCCYGRPVSSMTLHCLLLAAVICQSTPYAEAAWGTSLGEHSYG